MNRPIECTFWKWVSYRLQLVRRYGTSTDTARPSETDTVPIRCSAPLVDTLQKLKPPHNLSSAKIVRTVGLWSQLIGLEIYAHEVGLKLTHRVVSLCMMMRRRYRARARSHSGRGLFQRTFMLVIPLPFLAIAFFSQGWSCISYF